MLESVTQTVDAQAASLTKPVVHIYGQPESASSHPADLTRGVAYNLHSTRCSNGDVSETATGEQSCNRLGSLPTQACVMSIRKEPYSMVILAPTHGASIWALAIEYIIISKSLSRQESAASSVTSCIADA
jgi:hypothetical protein